MKSQQRGANIPEVEVINVSAYGFWLWLEGRELFLPFSEFPWFREASIAALSAVERPSEDHLYWPQLDIDLSVRSVEVPHEFPLKYRAG